MPNAPWEKSENQKILDIQEKGYIHGQQEVQIYEALGK